MATGSGQLRAAPDRVSSLTSRARRRHHTRLRVAINLLTEDPRNPSGAHWFWTRMVPEMANRLLPGEELHLMLSPAARRVHPDYGEAVRYITFPWSNEHRVLRTASEHLFTPVRLPLSHIDVLNTGIAPLMNPSWSLVIHMKTMHAFTTPAALSIGARAYRRLNYQRSARLAEAIIINSNSLRSEIDQYLEVDPQKLQADLRGGRPRHLQARKSRGRSGACGLVRNLTAVRAVRVLALALQEL